MDTRGIGRLALVALAGSGLESCQSPVDGLDFGGAFSGLSIDASGMPWDVALGPTPWAPDGRSLLATSWAKKSERGLEPGELLRISLDGTTRRLTPRAMAGAFAPDGKSFVCLLGPLQEHALTISDVDGNAQRSLSASIVWPTWSPDGHWIAGPDLAGPTDRDSRILVVSADGSVTRDLGPGLFSAWSPDGTRLACAVPDSANTDSWIELVQLDSGQRTRLTHGWVPSWAPKGGFLVFEDRDGSGNALFRITADGTDRRRLCAGEFPRWSPRSNRILFTRSVTRGGLWTIAADGSDERPLVADSRNGRWSPDGSKIAFVCNTSHELCIVNADGSGVRALGSLDGDAHP